MSYKEGFDLYLAGHVEQARQAFSPYKANYGAIEVIDVSGTLTSWGAELICSEYKLNKLLNSALASAATHSIQTLSPELRLQLHQCQLLDSDNALTSNGYYKFIEALPLNEQTARLGISYEELAFPKEDRPKVEHYVVRHFEQRGFRCFADEGHIFSLLISLSLVNELDRLNEFSQFDLKDPPATGGMNLRTFHNDFACIPFRATPDRKMAILQIIERTTRARIQSGIDLLRRAGARKMQHYDATMILEFFDMLGTDRLLQITRFLLDHPNCDTGWPDITAFMNGEVVLVEVKQNDKLRFTQARTIGALTSHLSTVLPQIQVCKVRLL